MATPTVIIGGKKYQAGTDPVTGRTESERQLLARARSGLDFDPTTVRSSQDRARLAQAIREQNESPNLSAGEKQAIGIKDTVARSTSSGNTVNRQLNRYQGSQNGYDAQGIALPKPTTTTTSTPIDFGKDVAQWERELQALKNRRSNSDLSPEAEAKVRAQEKELQTRINESKKQTIRNSPTAGSRTDIAGLQTAADTAAQKVKAVGDVPERGEDEDNESYQTRLAQYYKNLATAKSEGIEGARAEAQQNATTYETGFEEEVVPTDEELENLFFSSSRAKLNEERDKFFEEKAALEKEMLEFQQQEAEDRAEEFYRRAGTSAAALTGGALGFGGGNIGLATGIQAQGIKHLENLERAGNLDMRALIMNQDQIRMELDEDKQADLDNFIITKKEEVLQRNIRAEERRNKMFEQEMAIRADQRAENAETRQLLEFIDGQRMRELQVQELTGRIMQQQQDQILARYNLPFQTFKLAQETTGINEASVAYMTKFLSDQGIEIDPAMFETAQGFDAMLKFAAQVSDLPPAVAGALAELYDSEEFAKERAILKGVQESINQMTPQEMANLDKTIIGNQQALFDLNQAISEATGGVGIYGNTITQDFGNVSPLTGDNRALAGGGFGTPGLDIDLQMGDPVASTVSGTVVDASQFLSPGDNSGLGNKVAIQDGQGNVHFFNHMKTPGVQVGQTVNIGQIIGAGGNSGASIPGKGGDGTHLDYRILSPDGQWIDPKPYVQEFAQISRPLTDLEEIAAKDLSTRLFGKRAGTDPKNITAIGNMLKKGMTIDDIEDTLRNQRQSPFLIEQYRGAIESIGLGLPAEKRENLNNEVDRLLSEGNTGEAEELLKRAARQSVGVDKQNQILGAEYTIQFLSEIENDMQDFVSKGGKLNVFSGTDEKIRNKVGATKNPELAKIGTKIAAAIQNYRRSMSGVAFSVPESEEYKEMFPNIKSNLNLSVARSEALKSVFQSQIENFYAQQMGASNYDKIFVNPPEFNQTSEADNYLNSLPVDDISNYTRSLTTPQ